VTDSLLAHLATPPIPRMPELREALSPFPPQLTLVASSYDGHPIAFSCAVARAGVPVTLLHGSLSPNYRSALAEFDLQTVDLGQVTGQGELLSLVRASMAMGRYVVVVFDAPVTAGREQSLLGYQVQASGLVQILCRRLKVNLLPLLSSLTAESMLDYRVFPQIAHNDELLQRRLFNHLQSSLVSNPFQYKWTSECLLLGDPSVRSACLTFLNDATDFRHRNLSVAHL
jgi:hypothetical protein